MKFNPLRAKAKSQYLVHLACIAALLLSGMVADIAPVLAADSPAAASVDTAEMKQPVVDYDTQYAGFEDLASHNRFQRDNEYLDNQVPNVSEEDVAYAHTSYAIYLHFNYQICGSTFGTSCGLNADSLYYCSRAGSKPREIESCKSDVKSKSTELCPRGSTECASKDSPIDPSDPCVCTQANSTVCFSTFPASCGFKTDKVYSCVTVGNRPVLVETCTPSKCIPVVGDGLGRCDKDPCLCSYTNDRLCGTDFPEECGYIAAAVYTCPKQPARPQLVSKCPEGNTCANTEGGPACQPLYTARDATQPGAAGRDKLTTRPSPHTSPSHDMDPPRHAVPRHERRKAASPYARPKDASNTLRRHKKTPTPYWKKRFARFINPWRAETDDEDEAEGPALESEADDSSASQEDIEQQDTPTGQPADRTDAMDVAESDEAAEETEAQDENAVPSFPTESSSMTLVESSFELVVTSDDSFLGDEDTTAHRMRQQEREESLVSGQDSDSMTDIRDSKSTKLKRDSRSATPVRSTRRTTRSQAARADDDSSPEKNTSLAEHESAAQEVGPEVASETVQESGADSLMAKNQTTQDPVTSEEQAELTKPKGGKKKKKGKKRSKKGDVDSQVEELEKEIAQSNDRIAEKIQETEALIEASEELLQDATLMDEGIAHPLNDSNGPFSEERDVDEPADMAEDDDQTFHSTTQFDLADDDEDEDPGYPVIEYDDLKYAAEDENADTVKYYPPSPFAHEEPEVIDTAVQEITGHQGAHDSSQESTTDRDAYDGSEQSPSPPSAEPMQFMDSEEIEFSPMQSPQLTAAPEPTLQPSKDIRLSTPIPEPTTPSSKEHFVDCPPIVTPKKQEPIREIFSTPSSAINFTTTDVPDLLARFFKIKSRKGKQLTHNQALACHQLIEQAAVDDAWDHSEDGVSFRTQSTVPRQVTPIKPVRADNLEQESPSTVVTSLSQSSGADGSPRLGPAPKIARKPQASIAVKEVRPVAPFRIKRRAEDDLRLESSKPELAPSLDDYLEIEKYAGVQWDDLPQFIQTRRLIIWGDTDAPDTVKRRKIEEKEQVRTRNIEIKAFEKEKREKLAKEEQAAKEARDAKVHLDSEDDMDGRRTQQRTKKDHALPKSSVMRSNLASVAAADSAEDALDMSDDRDDNDSDGDAHKRQQSSKSDHSLLKPAVALASVASVAAAAVAEHNAENAPDVSSVAKKILDIIGKSSTKADEEPTLSTEEVTKDPVVTASVKSPAPPSFAPFTSSATFAPPASSASTALFTAPFTPSTSFKPSAQPTQSTPFASFTPSNPFASFASFAPVATSTTSTAEEEAKSEGEDEIEEVAYGMPDYDELSENRSDKDDNSEGSYDLGEEQEDLDDEQEEDEEEEERDEAEAEDEESQFNFDFGDDISDTEIAPVILDDEDDAPMSPISW
ncbi:hypothetical protein EC968_000784 [Mortierella alpina]|nr:hypothetical protein EC968_000784 [Mortierella alpina]